MLPTKTVSHTLYQADLESLFRRITSLITAEEVLSVLAVSHAYDPVSKNWTALVIIVQEDVELLQS